MTTMMKQMVALTRSAHWMPNTFATAYMFFAPPIGIGLFVLGWIFQFIGHAFEGKAPSFFRDPTFLLVGATWYGTRLVAFLTGKPLDEPQAQA